MTENTLAGGAGNFRRGSIGRRASGAVLLAWIAIFTAPSVDAAEPARDAGAKADAADRLNHQQALAAAPQAQPSRSSGVTEDVGVLFLRSDGGDPQELRIDDPSNLIFVARRNGEGRAYWNGREIDINPALRESAGQIAVAQFGSASGGEIPLSRLPGTAQDALRQFQGNSAAARVLYAHSTSRKDTGWVSDKRATKILAIEASANGRTDLVALIKTAMRMFDLKSDACDNSVDSRCDQPGVRDAFAQIKREEALQGTAARF